jgi:hypothetical protein
MFALAHVQEADIVEVFGQVKNYDDMLASEDNLIIAIKKNIKAFGLHNKDLGGLGEQDAVRTSLLWERTSFASVPLKS